MRLFLQGLARRLSSYLGRESASYVLCCENFNTVTFEYGSGYKFTTDIVVVKSSIGGLNIENKKFDSWLHNGSELCIADSPTLAPAPRGWIHYRGSRAVSFFNCTLGEDVAWLGPDFVPQEYRGKGHHSHLIQQRIAHVNERRAGVILFTGINVSNTSSLKNYIRNGFQIVALLRSRRFLFFVKKELFIYSDAMHGRLVIG